jgi:hypothetical protein
MDDVRCFLLEPTQQFRRYLRRYDASYPHEPCPGRMSYHDARYVLDDVELPADTKNNGGDFDFPHDDPRWPTHCTCGYKFVEKDFWQAHTHRLYRRSDTGALTTIHDAPPGAMWYATWLEEHDYPKGPDGRILIIRLPNGNDWQIDGRASNCDMKDDDVHRCWVRHGVPPDVTVDKDGVTCHAGAGSIQSGDWHGFLEDGMLVLQRKH